MSLEPFTPDNTTVVLVDHAVGFATLLRTQDIATHLNNVVGLARTALLYGAGLVVTTGEASKPSGPLYPELLAVLGDHPVVTRTGGRAFNSFLDEAFQAAVRATGRPKLAVAGISTDGCVLQTALGGLREGYEVGVVLDASASSSQEGQDIAVLRMVQAGVVPMTWWGLAAEFQLDPRFEDSPVRMQLMQEFQKAQLMGARAFFAGVEQGRLVTTDH